MSDLLAGALSESPYPGLRAFRREESDIFFGREEQTDALLKKVQNSRFLAVVGSSGCGKSSLVRAGMIGSLETGCMALAGSQWRVVEMRPGDRPLGRLAGALWAQAAIGARCTTEAESVSLLEGGLRRGPLGLIEAVRESPPGPGVNLLLLVDQFEEIFRFREKGDRDEADAFVALLLASVRQAEAPIYVVITMRSDFLGDCALFTGLPEAINDSQYLTPRLTREQCRLAIVGPAKVFGGTVESTLVNRLLNDFGPDPDQLPLLQHALMRMWDRADARGARAVPPITLMLEDYEALGGLNQALSDHADEVFRELTPPRQRTAEHMFRRLTERGVGKRDTRAPARVDDIAAVSGVAWEEVVAVAEAFRRADRSFLMPPPGMPITAATLLDIGHESLIRQWRQLGQWVELEARSAATYLRLVDTARRWRAGESALWRNPDLGRALDWEAKERPSAAWARRYASDGDFELAHEFLRASEAAWREEERQRETELERRYRDDLKRYWFKRGAAIAGVLMILMAVGWGKAWLSAREATAALGRERAALAAESAERQRADLFAARLANAERAKRAFLTGDIDTIRSAIDPADARSPLFGAGYRQLGWKTGDDKPVYNIDLFPTAQALAGPLQGATQISYYMDHPTFQQKLLTGDAAKGFVASYNGWGCLETVYALVEFANPDTPPRAYGYPMCAVLRQSSP